jgi:hypothetical protein
MSNIDDYDEGKKLERAYSLSAIEFKGWRSAIFLEIFLAPRRVV